MFEMVHVHSIARPQTTHGVVVQRYRATGASGRVAESANAARAGDHENGENANRHTCLREITSEAYNAHLQASMWWNEPYFQISV